MMPGMTDPSRSLPRRAALTEALLGIVVERGLDQVSVREVAAAAGVSIGTVQHYFPTKDAMLSAAYHEVLSRLRSRLRAVPLGADTRGNLAAVLTELLPLDRRRIAECRVHLAFAARAAISPELAEIQRAALVELHAAVTDAFALAWDGRVARAACALAAQAAIAGADGLALHAVSSAGWLSGRRQRAVLDTLLDGLLSVGSAHDIG